MSGKCYARPFRSACSLMILLRTLQVVMSRSFILRRVIVVFNLVVDDPTESFHRNMCAHTLQEIRYFWRLSYRSNWLFLLCYDLYWVSTSTIHNRSPANKHLPSVSDSWHLSHWEQFTGLPRCYVDIFDYNYCFDFSFFISTVIIFFLSFSFLFCLI